MSMRISFKSLARPRRAAKALCENIPGMKLSEAQSVVARMCDCDSWVDLKRASEQPDAQASPDDEDLTAEALEARLDFQAQQVRAIFGNTLKQAREIVRLVSPTARTPVRPPNEPPSRRPALKGAKVFMPSPFTRFAPSYPEVFGFLDDVDHLRVEFIQPNEHEVTGAHLASDVTFTFANGKKLSLQGAYFWKFLDTAPRELLDARGDFLHPNPYARDPVEVMVQRLRAAYHFLFTDQSDKEFHEPAPLWIELDLVNGNLTRRNPIGLQGDTKETLWALFERVLEESGAKLQPVVDGFMVEVLTGPRVELKLVNKGGRGSMVLGNEYVRSSWAGTGHWTLKDLLMELSPEPLHPSGCGGNLSYRVLFDRAVQSHFAAALLSACLEALDTPDLYAALHSQLELPAQKGRVKAETRARQLMDGLLATNLRLELAFTFSNALVRKQGDRTFNSWHAAISIDDSLTRPTVRLEEILDRHRVKA